MFRPLPALVTLALLVQAPAPWSYPPTKTGDATDTYFGKTYKDPYRWLENLKDKDVEASRWERRAMSGTPPVRSPFEAERTRVSRRYRSAPMISTRLALRLNE